MSHSHSHSTSTFHHPTSQTPISLPPTLSRDQLLAFPPFTTWHANLTAALATPASGSYKLRRIDVQAADFFRADRLGFVKLKAEIKDEDGGTLPGSVFLRGGSVGMMIVLQPDDVPASSDLDKHVLLTVQPRIPTASLSFTELPAGMLDSTTGSFAGGAAREIKEETGLEIGAEELVDMTALALEGHHHQQEEEEEEGEKERELQKGVYPSAGGCDEFVALFYVLKRMPRGRMEGLRGKLTGLRGEGEKITLRLVRMEEVWRVGGRDAKVLSAWGLYCGLRAEGRL